MRLLAAATAVSGLVLATGAGPAAGAAPRHVGVRAAPGAAGTWGKAIEVPGLAALNVRGAEVISVSCASAGNCSAVGPYMDSSSKTHGFVVSQSRGRWGKAIEVPGLAALSADGLVGSPRYRAAQRVTAQPAGLTRTALANFRGSWSARATGSGARPSKCPAWAR